MNLDQHHREIEHIEFRHRQRILVYANEYGIPPPPAELEMMERQMRDELHQLERAYSQKAALLLAR